MDCFHTYNNIRQKSQTLQPMRNIDKDVVSSFFSRLNSADMAQEPANYANVIPDASEETLLMQSTNIMRPSPSLRNQASNLAASQHHHYNQHQQQELQMHHNSMTMSHHNSQLRRGPRNNFENQPSSNQQHHNSKLFEAQQQQNFHFRSLSQFQQIQMQHQHQLHQQQQFLDHNHLMMSGSNANNNGSSGPDQSPATTDQDNQQALNEYYNLMSFRTTAPKLTRHHPPSLQNSLNTEHQNCLEELKQLTPPPATATTLLQSPQSNSKPANQLDTLELLKICYQLGQLDSYPQMPPSRSYAIASSNKSRTLFKVSMPHRRFLKSNYSDSSTGVTLAAGSMVYVLGPSQVDRSKFTIIFNEQHQTIDIPHQLTDIARPLMGPTIG